MRFARLFAVAAFALSATAALAAPPMVTISGGAIAGTSTGAIDVYKGIPYAAPPVGPLRWMPPAPPAAWHGTFNAASFGAICPQPKRPDGVLAAGFGLEQSEDCLSLNVWAPHGGHRLPVMVWIHGGAHRFGSGASPIYDGMPFAQDGVILVTINYRLGLLGYFAHPALTKAAAPDAPLGNYGQMDQIAALKWVKANIAAFGGDPDNITVFGESAGGSSILFLLNTPAAKGLFAKAIVESGGGWGGDATLADKEAEGAAFATKEGLPGANATLEQLRALPVEKTFDIPPTLGFGPFVDGRLVTESPASGFRAGRALDVPLIIGSNDFEASLMTSFDIPSARMLSRVTPDLRHAYASDATNDDTLAHALFTDAVMGGPAHWVAGKESSGAPVFLYHFSYVAAVQRGSAPGARHGSEIPYVFATGSELATRFHITLTDQDIAMQTLMHSCWVGFAKTGHPDCKGQSWPAFTPANDTLMEFGQTIGPVSGFRAQQYRALEKVYKPD